LDYTQKRFLDFRSDLFLLGIVLYEAATGTHPFWVPRMSIGQAQVAIIRDTPVLPSTRRPEIPAPLNVVIMRLLAKQPHLRYRSTAQLQEVLDAIKL
jgi:serine/threonine-protein kinase